MEQLQQLKTNVLKVITVLQEQLFQPHAQSEHIQLRMATLKALTVKLAQQECTVHREDWLHLSHIVRLAIIVQQDLIKMMQKIAQPDTIALLIQHRQLNAYKVHLIQTKSSHLAKTAKPVGIALTKDY